MATEYSTKWRYTIVHAVASYDSYDVLTFDEIWPEHKEAVALLEAAYSGEGIFELEGIGTYERFETLGPLIHIMDAYREEN